MIVPSQRGREAPDIQSLQKAHRKRRYRGHAIFALIIFVTLGFVVLQTDNPLSKWVRPASFTKFNGDFDTISPFAKAKVRNPLSLLM
jgi:hypothetical protein